MMQTVAWPNPHFVILPHNPAEGRYPEDEVTGLPMQACHLKRLKDDWQDTRLKEFGMYFRVMSGGFLIAMQ